MDFIRNEMEIEVAGKKILVRAEFDSLRKFEQAVGGIGKFMKPIGENNMVNLTDAALLIYYTQASNNEKQYSLDECFEMVMKEGVYIAKSIMVWVAKITAGNNRVEGLGDSPKKG